MGEITGKLALDAKMAFLAPKLLEPGGGGELGVPVSPDGPFAVKTVAFSAILFRKFRSHSRNADILSLNICAATSGGSTRRLGNLPPPPSPTEKGIWDSNPKDV